MVSVFIMMLAVFWARVKQLSTIDKSACLKNTGNTAITLQKKPWGTFS
jgi:hypothetical protein